MSRARRIALIFVALLLAGASALAVYVESAMPAPDALRFSLVDATGPREIYAGLSGPCSIETIAIQNTSAVPVHLISMWVAEEQTSGTARVNVIVTAAPAPAPARESLSASPGEIIIAPRDTVYATSGVPVAGITAEPHGNSLHMHYLWQSRVHHLTGRVLEWLHARSPRALQGHVPGVTAALHHAQIDRPALTASTASTP